MKQQMTFQSRPGGTWPGVARQRALALALFVGGLLCLLALGGLHVGAQGLRSPGNPQPFPQPNSHTVPATSTVGITYDEPISPTTVTSRTFVVQAMQTGQLLATYGVHSGTITLTPTQPLRPGELVQVSATTGTLGLIDGTGPLTPTVWQFRAGAPAGSGNLVSNDQPTGTSFSWAVALGDLDQDGDLDVLLGNRDQASQVWFYGGTGRFYNSGQSLAVAPTVGAALGDLDGDGDLDAFLANYGNIANTVWLNDGAGFFADSGQQLGNEQSWDVVLGDVDGDGDLDALVSNVGPNSLWLNDGSGGMTLSQSIGGSEITAKAALADVDGDGDLDAFFANYATPNQVWLNDGHGLFSDTGQQLGGYATTWSVGMGDVDGDGDADAFFATRDNGPNQLWLNEGSGTFANSGQVLSSLNTYDVAMADFDGDGDLDIYEANASSQPDLLWLNDGLGILTDSGLALGEFTDFSADAGDFGGDGDIDVYSGIFPYNNKAWLNNLPPLLAVNALSEVVYEGEPVILSGQMHDPDVHDKLTLQVDWGDGFTDTYPFLATTTDFTVTHQYLDDEPTGTPWDENVVAVTLRDGDGSQDSMTTTVRVNNVPPLLADLSLTTPLNEHDTLTLSGRIVDPSPLDTFTLVVIWETGAQANYHYPAGTTQFSESHQYLDDNPSGTPVDPITITLILVDDDTGTVVETLGGEIHNLPPVVVAGADQSGIAGQPLSFSGSFSDVGTLDTHTVQWDFGDGSAPVSGTLTPTHTFAAAGSYTVRLTVTDDDTGVGEDTLTVTVMPSSYPLFLPFLARPAAASPPIPGRAALPPRQLFQ